MHNIGTSHFNCPVYYIERLSPIIEVYKFFAYPFFERLYIVLNWREVSLYAGAFLSIQGQTQAQEISVRLKK